MFTLENTNGYTQSELDALNNEFLRRMAAEGIDRATDAGAETWDEAEKAFADEVASRRGR